jgi:hypothetical protein
MKKFLTKISSLLDLISNFLAPRKGFFPLIGMALILLNFLLQFVTPSWLAQTNLFLHLGIILAIIGLMLSWAL